MADPNLAFADQGDRQVGQRGEVARGSHRALGRNGGQDPGVEQAQERVQQVFADAAVAAGQGIDLQEDDAPDFPLRQQRTGTGCVGEHQAALKLLDVAVGNEMGGQGCPIPC